ncbi:MAG: hypothetical protein HYU99_10040 [Deltaproteobacteria bacterium]|nr:hypothetical protein [Deltaproteobacteria bacterium]
MALAVLGIVFLSAVSIPITHAGICSVGDKAQVLWKGTWYPASVLKATDSQCFIHYDGYGSNWDEWVGSDRIKIGGAVSKADSAASGPFSEGDPVQVLWKGTWYPAHVLQAKGKQLYIHYDGYDSSWDEWVGPERYRK